MKWVIGLVLVLGLLVVGCCGGLIGLGWWAIRPTSFPEQTQDYADARKAFETTLTHQGPAPQPWEEEQPPEDVEEVEYTSGKLQLKAWVNPPPKRGPKKPAVLFLHGGYAFDSKDWSQCKPFRDAGFVTMTPMLRGENGLKGSFSLFYDEVDDVLAAAEKLAKIPGVDPDHIYVAGHSAGGTLAMLASMTSKRFRACASLSGSPDQVSFVRTNPEPQPPFDTEDRKELEMRSPLAFPKSFKCPARLYWGKEEIVLKFSTEKLAEKSQAAGLDVAAVEVPGDHVTSVTPAMRQAITFFQQK